MIGNSIRSQRKPEMKRGYWISKKARDGKRILDLKERQRESTGSQTKQKMERWIVLCGKHTHLVIHSMSYASVSHALHRRKEGSKSKLLHAFGK